MVKFRKTHVPLRILDMGESGYHLSLEAVINRKKCKLVLDTGASRTVLDKGEIKRLVKEEVREMEGKKSAGLGTDAMATHSAEIKRFKINSLVIENMEVLVLDLAILNRSYEQLGHDRVVGVMGSDLLIRYRAKIDLAKNRLTLEWPLPED